MARRREAARRRRAAQLKARRAAVLLIIAAVVLVVGALALRSGSSGSTPQATVTQAVSRRGQRPRRRARRPAAKRERRLADNPFTTRALRSYLASRSGAVTIAVDDRRTGQTWIYHPGYRERTASVVKADILETLLRRDQENGTQLRIDDASVIEGMIEQSNNDDATELWNALGGSDGVGSYNEQAGLTQTDLNPDGYWGLTTTSALDQIRLLRQLVTRHGLLDARSRNYQLQLMRSVESDQDWGVSAGVPAGVSVALKNGWLPLISSYGWEINSIGSIKGAGRSYLIAVLTANDPSEAYGIETIGQISKFVWNDLAPARMAAKPRSSV